LHLVEQLLKFNQETSRTKEVCGNNFN